MINAVTVNLTKGLSRKKSGVKNLAKEMIDLPKSKAMITDSKIQFAKKGPFCGIDSCAI